MRQNGITGAEVVDGDLDADFLQRLEGLAGGVDVTNHGAFGDLQTHRATVDAELVDGFGDAVDEASADQLGGGHIEPQHGVLPDAARTPAAELPDRGSHDPTAQLVAQVCGFGDADERLGQ